MTKMDCQSTSEAGYVAIVNTLIDESIKDDVNRLLDVASVVFKIVDVSQTEIMQRFSGLKQIGVKLW